MKPNTDKVRIDRVGFRTAQPNLLRKVSMQIRYDPEADVLILILRDLPPIDSIAEPGGMIVSYGEGGEPVAIELLNASKKQWMQPMSPKPNRP
jgi:uncharacterized protein YuzE